MATMIEISGKNMKDEMRRLAKEAFAEQPTASCVCVGVSTPGSRKASGRRTDGSKLQAYVAWSGNVGRAMLRDALRAEGVLEEEDNGRANTRVTSLLETMAARLKIYGSSTQGSAVVHTESWVTHNCAESNLMLFLYQRGVNTKNVVIAAYSSTSSGSVTFKSLCQQCQQWVPHHMGILTEYNTYQKTKDHQ